MHNVTQEWMHECIVHNVGRGSSCHAWTGTRPSTPDTSGDDESEVKESRVKESGHPGGTSTAMPLVGLVAATQGFCGAHVVFWIGRGPGFCKCLTALFAGIIRWLVGDTGPKVQILLALCLPSFQAMCALSSVHCVARQDFSLTHLLARYGYCIFLAHT